MIEEFIMKEKGGEEEVEEGKEWSLFARLYN